MAFKDSDASMPQQFLAHIETGQNDHANREAVFNDAIAAFGIANVTKATAE